MIKTVKVELSIKDHATGIYMLVPVVPESIPYAEGEKQADTVSILNLGDVDFLSGVSLDTFQIISFFPGRYDASYCQTSKLKTPMEYKALFKSWKNNGTPLQIICPAAGINERMTLRTFEGDLQGFEGDIYYRASFTQAKTVKPKKIVVGGKPPAKGQKTPAERPKPPAPPVQKTYTVVSGDYLIKIAKKFGISDWRNKLYIPNKKPKGPLGNDPNLIFPGQKLKLP